MSYVYLKLLQETLLSGGALSASLQSASVILNDESKNRAVTSYSIQATWSGSGLGGSFELQASNDGVTFVKVSSSTVTVSTDSGSAIWNVDRASDKLRGANVFMETDRALCDP